MLLCTSAKNFKCNDSIEGIMFLSAGLKDFPKEIFNCKNLKVIWYSNYLWSEKYGSLSRKQKLKYDKLFKVRNTPPALQYNVSSIKKVPKEILNLTKLEIFGIYGARISYEEIDRVEKLLPNVKLI